MRKLANRALALLFVVLAAFLSVASATPTPDDAAATRIAELNAQQDWEDRQERRRWLSAGVFAAAAGVASVIVNRGTRKCRHCEALGLKETRCANPD